MDDVIGLAIAGLTILLLMLVYLRIASFAKIIDQPNHRSSHQRSTVRGGGIIFLFALVLWYIFYFNHTTYFIFGAVLIGLVSFLDDLFSLPALPRLVVHILAVCFLLVDVLGPGWPWFTWFLGMILIIGWINAFNFMDGINGISAFYSLSVIAPIYFLNQSLMIIDSNLIILITISVLIFTFFNARKTALCFAGDVGSVTMAFILGYLVANLIMKTGHWEYLLFLSVYGVDSFFTIVQRLIKGENILQPHRSHLYQFLANEIGLGHLKVAGLYAFTQLGISALILFPPSILSGGVFALIMLTLLVVVYLVVKIRVMRSIYHTE